MGLTIDTFHMQLEESNYRQAIRNVQDQIRHVHLADNTRTEPGSGSLNLTAIFQALKAIDNLDGLKWNAENYPVPE